MPILRRLVPLVLLLSVTACGSKQDTAERPKPPRTTVRVENHNYLDMKVYVIRGGQRIRLGEVPGSGSRTFTLPSRILFGITSLQFMADPIGSSRTPVSQSIPVHPGDRLSLVIPAS